MRQIKYFFQFLIIIIFFLIFKIIGLKFSSKISYIIVSFIGPFFRSRKIIESNIQKAIPNLTTREMNNIIKKMWGNYGRILSEYVFIKNFRNGKLNNNIKVDGQKILDEIRKNKDPVIFVSGHFNNFELMAMHIEKTGINLSAIYRPLNNIFLNKIMERIRKKYICKNQIKKGIGGMKKLIKLKKNNYSTALMIDQRVSEGIKANFFNQEALTTTIPAQLIKKFNIPVVPIYIERNDDINFKIIINKPINFPIKTSAKEITNELNHILEKMIMLKPEQWIWSHNRWK